jgi:hypothetical protein
MLREVVVAYFEAHCGICPEGLKISGVGAVFRIRDFPNARQDP